MIDIDSGTKHTIWRDSMNENPEELQMQEETPEARYNALVDQFVQTKGWSRRKARRYLDAYAKREHARIIKEGKARQEKLRKEGKLIDTSQDRLQMESEFQEQLKEAGIKLEDSSYKPPTSDF